MCKNIGCIQIMMEDNVGAILLLITSILSVILALFLFWNFVISKKMHHLLWGISLIVLSFFGLIIIYNDFGTLSEPIVPVISSLIPICLAVGILYAVWGDHYLVVLFALYESTTLLLVIIAEFLPIKNMISITIMLVHTPAGLVMFFVPIIAYLLKEIDISGLLFTFGVSFIGLIGLLFAFNALDTPVLNYSEIISILPLAYLISAIFLGLGMKLPKKWSFELKPSITRNFYLNELNLDI